MITLGQTARNWTLCVHLVEAHVDYTRHCSGRPELVGTTISHDYVRGLVHELWPGVWA